MTSNMLFISPQILRDSIETITQCDGITLVGLNITTVTGRCICPVVRPGNYPITPNKIIARVLR